MRANILDFTESDSGRCSLKPVEFEVKALLHDVVRPFAEHAHGKEIAMSIDIQSAVPT